jgi:hypothetical protein
VFLRLPQKENVIYRMTMHVQDDQTFETLETSQFRLYVPYQQEDINAQLTADQREQRLRSPLKSNKSETIS